MYRKTNVIIEHNVNINYEKIMRLCFHCITEWLYKGNGTCILCRELIHEYKIFLLRK